MGYSKYLSLVAANISATLNTKRNEYRRLTKSVSTRGVVPFCGEEGALRIAVMHTASSRTTPALSWGHLEDTDIYMSGMVRYLIPPTVVTDTVMLLPWLLSYPVTFE